MEHNVRRLPAEVLMEPLLELLEQMERIPLVVSGNSMYPFLLHERDTVFLSKPKKPPKRGDVILYRRGGGQYVLHRVLRVEDGALTLLGDAQTGPEPGILPQQVLAVVSAVRRRGRLLEKGCLVWTFYEKIWLRLIPLRPLLIRVCRRIRGDRLEMERDV